MKVLVTGAEGQLGYDVVRFFRERGTEVYGCGRAEMDITDLNQCKSVISKYQPECIIHCAAYTSVDAAEANIDEAYLVNTDGSRNVTIAAQMIGAKLVYLSTDYVFDGSNNEPYHEYDNTEPQSIYGKSKRAGELLVQNLSTRWFIVRTSWVFGSNGTNFVKSILKLGQEKSSLQVVNDQQGSPTYTLDLARFLHELVHTEKYGIYHASNYGACTWYEFAKVIFSEANNIRDTEITAMLEPCTTEQFPRPAKRPKYSVMDNIAIRTNGFQVLRPWEEAVRDYIVHMRT